jgi:hypothetical protein
MAPREIKHLFTEKGEVLQAIVMYGAKTLADIQSIFNQSLTVQWTPLNVLLDELIKEGDVYLNEAGEYTARTELEEDYSFYEEHMDEWLEPPMEWEIEAHLDQRRLELERLEKVPSSYPEIISATESWIKLHKPELKLKNEHFYLEGHYLDIFTKFVITQSFKTIIVVNPFLDLSMPVQLLVKAKRMGKTVVIVTRNSFKPHIKKFHEWLTKAGIKLLYHKNLHAKITIIDDSLSIVSSMNFQYNATAGISWEAGIVTINKETVDSIKASIADLGLTHENPR